MDCPTKKDYPTYAAALEALSVKLLRANSEASTNARGATRGA